jgi:hypothetical protein
MPWHRWHLLHTTSLDVLRLCCALLLCALPAVQV